MMELVAHIPDEDHKVLRALSFYTGRSMNEIMGRALHLYLAGEARSELLDASIEQGRRDMRDLLERLADGGDVRT